MRKVFLHISALAAVLLLCLACSGDRASVIPRGKLAKIYAEMLVMDQWAQSESHLRATADTSLIYEPIFHKYGFDIEDYTRSVEYYMQDPERFSRILRQTTEILDHRIEELNMLKKELKRQMEISSFVTDFNIAEFYPYLSDEPYVHYYDSLAVEADSGYVYRIVPIERADTLYDRLVMVINRDTTAVDTLAVQKDAIQKETAEMETIKVEPIKDEFVKGASDIMKPEKISEELVVTEIKPLRKGAPSKLLKHAKLDTLKRK